MLSAHYAESAPERFWRQLESRINPEITRRFERADFAARRELLGTLASAPPFAAEDGRSTIDERISIVGTNGKGSTAFYLSRLLESGIATGDCVGLYTSPHLNSALERIRLNSQPITAERAACTWFEMVDQLRAAHPGVDLDAFTWFEALTLLAHYLFTMAGCRIAIYEAGLGGRFDATRMANATTLLLTSISLDHTDVLGGTLDAILDEKLAIAGPSCRQVIAMEQSWLTTDELKERIRQKAPATTIHLFADHPNRQRSYLAYNAGFARFAASAISGRNLSDSGADITAHGIPGRMERRRHAKWGATLLFDTAHNSEAYEYLLLNLLAESSAGRLPPCDRQLLFLATLKDRSPLIFAETRQRLIDSGASEVAKLRLVLLEGDGFATLPELLQDDPAWSRLALTIETIERRIDSGHNSGIEAFLFFGSHRLYNYFNNIPSRENP